MIVSRVLREEMCVGGPQVDSAEADGFGDEPGAQVLDLCVQLPQGARGFRADPREK